MFVTPTIFKKQGVFLFSFSSHEDMTDMTKIYEGPASFVFDKPQI